jgi:Flp pilus assembly protein TadD
MPLLSDPVRTVRMQAARTLALLADDAFDSPESLAAFRRAADEFIAAERFNADRPEHRTNLGGFFADRGEMVVAEEEYRAALRLDTRFVPAWANLADLMRLQGREIEAESILREGLELSPQDATLHHALGLSLVRQQRGPFSFSLKVCEPERDLEAALPAVARAREALNTLNKKDLGECKVRQIEEARGRRRRSGSVEKRV